MVRVFLECSSPVLVLKVVIKCAVLWCFHYISFSIRWWWWNSTQCNYFFFPLFSGVECTIHDENNEKYCHVNTVLLLLFLCCLVSCDCTNSKNNKMFGLLFQYTPTFFLGLMLECQGKIFYLMIHLFLVIIWELFW